MGPAPVESRLPPSFCVKCSCHIAPMSAGKAACVLEDKKNLPGQSTFFCRDRVLFFDCIIYGFFVFNMRCDSIGCKKKKYHMGLCTREEVAIGASKKGRPKPYDRPTTKPKDNVEEGNVQESMKDIVKMFTIYEPARGSDGYSLQDVYSMLTESCDMKMDKHLFFQSDFTSLMKKKIESYRMVNDIEGVGGPRYKPGRCGMSHGTPRFYGIKYVPLPRLKIYTEFDTNTYKFLRFEHHDKWMARFLHKGDNVSFLVGTSGWIAESRTHLGRSLSSYHKSACALVSTNDAASTIVESSDDEDENDCDVDTGDNHRNVEQMQSSSSIEVDSSRDNNGAIGLLSLSGSPLSSSGSTVLPVSQAPAFSPVNSTITMPPPSLSTVPVTSVDDIVVGLDPVLKKGILDWLQDNDMTDINLLKEIGQEGLDDMMSKLPFKNPNGHAAQLIRKRIAAM
jgi:hypothetical protein